jgi:nicotinamidase/pyrazinamidase
MMLDRRQVLAALGTSALVALAPTAILAATSIKPDDASALLVIDVQNCFLPGGSLAVKEGEQVVPVINKISKAFSNVVMTQDWHTQGHVSFASVHAGKKPFETVDLPYGKTSRSRTPSSSSARVFTRTSTAIRPSSKPMARPRPALPAI